jgi:hypothetical protein
MRSWRSFRSQKSQRGKLFPAVWAMRRKTRPHARSTSGKPMNLDGSKQGRIDYDQTFAPVATWESIRLLLGMVLKNKWKTKQLDYVLAFPQAPVDRECFMKMPLGITVDEPGEWALRVKRISTARNKEDEYGTCT